MSIEIKAKVNRENAIFMAGESFIVSIFLRNTNELQPSSLAWGCVQLHCDQLLMKSVQLDSDQKESEALKMTRRDKTSMPRAKRAIFSSTPTIIFCDIHLKARELMQFEHTIELPLHFPPTYKGHFVRYHWYLSVAVQHVDAPIKVLQLPVKVINMTVDVLTPMSATKKEPIFSENPFLLRDKQTPSIVEIASSKVEEVTSIRTLRTYEMKSASGIFAVITMFKNFFKLGDEVVGKISFPQVDLKNMSAINCLQVLVRLETIEVNLYGSKREEHISHIFTEHFVTAFLKEIHFKLPISLTAVPSFSTEAIQLRWRLHFEFVTSAQPSVKYPDPSANEEQFVALATDLNIDTMAWDVYISVHACNPYNIALVQNVSSSSVSLIV